MIVVQFKQEPEAVTPFKNVDEITGGMLQSPAVTFYSIVIYSSCNIYGRVRTYSSFNGERYRTELCNGSESLRSYIGDYSGSF
jgi:hypothetical protein